MLNVPIEQLNVPALAHVADLLEVLLHFVVLKGILRRFALLFFLVTCVTGLVVGVAIAATLAVLCPCGAACGFILRVLAVFHRVILERGA